MRNQDDIDAIQRELDRRAAEVGELERYHRAESRRYFWRTLPRNIGLLLTAIIIIWAVKSCESKDHAADPDRTGLRGMPY